MSETRTLHFENARQLQSLYANDLKLLKSLEDSLGVKVTTREGWVKLEGEPEKIDKAQRVFNQLEEAQKKGVPIQKHEFQYALNSVSESREDNLSDAVYDHDLGPGSRRSSRVRLQRNYVEAIDKRIVSESGRWHCKKTYPAVGMAVSALKKISQSHYLNSSGSGSGRSVDFAGRTRTKIAPYLRPLYDALRDMLEP
jgi:phosphate starvation-inducible PhoH-like protein